MISLKKMDKLEAVGVKAQIEELVNNEEFFGPAIDAFFQKYDTDKSGFIELEEFYTCLKELNDEAIHIPDFSKEKAKEYLGKLDKNNDGKLSKEECRPFLKQFLLNLMEDLQKMIDSL